MWTELYWLDGPWPGKLAVAARPRGGDWLGDEMTSWRRAGVDALLSLLTPDEERDLDLRSEANEAEANGIEFLSFSNSGPPGAQFRSPNGSYLRETRHRFVCWQKCCGALPAGNRPKRVGCRQPSDQKRPGPGNGRKDREPGAWCSGS